MALSDRFSTVENVKTYQENLNYYLGYTNTKNKFKASQVLQQEIARLKDLYSYLLSQEQRMFQINGIGSFENLKQKLREWDNSGASALVSNGERFEELVNTIADTIQLEDLNEKIATAAINNPEIQELFIIDAQEKLPIDEIANMFVNNLNMALGEGVHFRSTTAGRQFISGQTTSGLVGLFRYIVIGKPEKIKENGKRRYRYSISFNEAIPSRYKNRIYDLINKIANIEIRNIQTDAVINSQKEIIALFNKAFPLTGGAKKYILREFQNRFSYYDFNTSTASIKGALGEIYWTAFWNYITNGKNNAIPVGLTHAIGGVIKGQQLPMDILLKGLGFQVKNYHIDLQTGETIFHKEMLLDGYIKNRLQIDPQPFNDFYFSWAYNKVIDSPHARFYYQPLFNRFELIMQQLETNLQNFSTQKLDKILRLDTEFDSNLNIASKGNLKIVSAYLIGNKIIFSSDVVAAIIDQLESGSVDIGFKSFDIDYREPHTNPTWNLESRTLGKWPPPNNESPSSLMRGTTIKYEIYMNVNSLMAAAEKRLK